MWHVPEYITRCILEKKMMKLTVLVSPLAHQRSVSKNVGWLMPLFTYRQLIMSQIEMSQRYFGWSKKASNNAGYYIVR